MESEILPYILLVARFSELMLDIPIAKMLKRSEYNKLLRLAFIRILMLVFSVAIGLASESVVFFITTFIAGNTIIALYAKDNNGDKINSHVLISSLSMSFSSSIVAVQSNIPRYLMGYFQDFRELSFFTSGAFLVTALSVIINVFVQSQIVNLKSYLDTNNEKKIRKLIVKASLFGICIWTFFFVFCFSPILIEKYYRLYGLSGDLDVAKDSLYINMALGFVAIFQSIGAALMLAKGSLKQQLFSSIFFLFLAVAASLGAYIYLGYIFGLLAFIIITVFQVVYYFHHSLVFNISNR